MLLFVGLRKAGSEKRETLELEGKNRWKMSGYILRGSLTMQSSSQTHDNVSNSSTD